MADRDLSGRRLGEFVLREQIGEGGGGAVYRCTQPLLKRDAVIKVLRERQRSHNGAPERFLREAQLGSLLDHPYAAHVYAFGVEDTDGLLWIAMELVHGITLDQWLRERGPVSLETFVPFFECIADVVQAAHERGIVHRDLKPSNVMVIERGDRLIPKLLDFGIAKGKPEVAGPAPAAWPEGSLGENQAPDDPQARDGVVTRTDPTAKDWRLTPSGAGLGSSPYMCPEQWGNASAVGPASDIYALGVLAYKALTGRTPFTAASEAEYYRQHLRAEVPPLGGDFSPDLDRVFQRALAKTPDARHGSALELAADLRAALRASERELLRASAQQWEIRARPQALLLGGEVLAGVERWTRNAPSGVLSELECSYVATSQRRARRSAWIRRLAGSLAVTLVLGVVVGVSQYRAAMQTRLAQEQARSARRVTEATITQAELEQGRAALLHGEPEAQAHLSEAYRRGDHSPSTAFMLARALQPRLTEKARFTSTFGRMWSAAFSPDGRQIVTTDDKAAQVWDAQTYQLRFTLPHGDIVYQAIYSADATRIITAGGDGAVRIWDAASGGLLRELRPRGAKPRYYSVAMSPGGHFIAAIGIQGDIAHVWNAASGAVVAELPNDNSEFPSLAFSSDGRWLATSGGNDVRLFDTNTWRTALVIPGPRIHSLAFDPTAPRLITGSATGDASIWQIPTGRRLSHLREVGDSVDALAVASDGQLVVTASRDGTVHVWHAGSGKLQSQLSLRHGRVFAVEFDPTSQLVLAANADGTVVVADAALGLPVTVLEGPPNETRVAHFDPLASRVVGASRDGTARVWDSTSPYRRWTSPALSDDCGLVASAEPDRRFVAISCRDQATRVWDTAHDRLLAELPSVSRVAGSFTSAFASVSSGGDRAAIARGNAVQVYELPSGRLVQTIMHGAPVNAVAFATRGRDLVSGAVDGTLLVARDNGSLLALPVSAGGIDAVAFLSDGRVVAADTRRRVRLYEPGGAVAADLELPGRVMSLRPQGARLVTVPIYPSSADQPVLLDLESHRVVGQLAGHVGRVFSARWVSGDQIITAAGDGAARLWDGSTGQLRQTYRGGSRFLADATLTADGLVVGGDADGLLRFWDPTSARLLWMLQAHKSYVVGIHIEAGDVVTRGFSGELSRWTLPSAEQTIDACLDRDRCAIVPR